MELGHSNNPSFCKNSIATKTCTAVYKEQVHQIWSQAAVREPPGYKLDYPSWTGGLTFLAGAIKICADSLPGRTILHNTSNVSNDAIAMGNGISIISSAIFPVLGWSSSVQPFPVINWLVMG